MKEVTPPIDLVRAEITRSSPLAAFKKLIAENDALILASKFENGLEIAARRCAIYEGLMADWAEERRAEFGYDRPFAVVAVGGTGRGEMTPCSDTDFAFLFDDELEGNAFLLDLQRRVVHSSEFKKRCGFSGETFPFNFEALPELDEKQLNGFLDMRPLYDPDGLAGQFRERIRATYDPFEHFLHASKFWRDHWGESVGKHEQMDGFDIKMDGLRIFLAGIWALGGEGFRHSHEIYAELEDQRDLDAYGFLLSVRSFVHLRKGTRTPPTTNGNHAEDMLGFEDFTSFGDMLGSDASERERFEFANEVRALLMEARRRIDRFTWGVMGKVLKKGRNIRPGSAIVYGSGGLRDTATDRGSSREKSRAALAILLAAQRHGLPIDPSEMETTFRDAGDWLEPVPELSALFYEPCGSLAKSLEFLSQLPGATERLFPGYAKFEASLDERVMTERKSLRGALMREKIHALEEYLLVGRPDLDNPKTPHKLADTAFEISIPLQAALLDTDHLAAVKLALATKRLPETPEDVAAREDESKPLNERFSTGLSGIPLDEYYTRCFSGCGFTQKTLEVARSLVENRRAFKERANKDLMIDEHAEEIVRLCEDDEERLRALFVFTCADRADWEGAADEPSRWFNIHELYAKGQLNFHEDSDPTDKLSVVGYSPDQREILEDFGRDYFKGIYRHYAIRFGGHLLRLQKDSNIPPKIARLHVGMSEIIAVVCSDHPGIAASISGAFWKHGVGLRQAHLFSATNHGLALDFFHPVRNRGDSPSPDPSLDRAIQKAIVEQLYIRPEDEACLPSVARKVTLEKSASGLYRLRGETKNPDNVGAVIYELTYKAFRYLRANIHGLAAHTGKGHAWVPVHLSLPKKMSFDEAREIVEKWG